MMPTNLERHAMIKATMALLLAAGAATGAAGEPLTLPGGPSNPAHDGLVIYAEKPKAGKVPNTAACKLTERYMELNASGRFAEVANLFSDDAFFVEPANRKATRGREKIDAFFNRTIGPMKPDIVGVAYVGSGKECIVEIALKTRWNGATQYSIVSLDHFTLGKDGKFSRMIGFVRPLPPGMLPANVPEGASLEDIGTSPDK
jgi:hypothetical protein